jgi:hypothetical protein
VRSVAAVAVRERAYREAATGHCALCSGATGDAKLWEVAHMGGKDSRVQSVNVDDLVEHEQENTGSRFEGSKRQLD